MVPEADVRQNDVDLEAIPEPPEPEPVDEDAAPSNGNGKGASAAHPTVAPMVKEKRTIETTYPAGTPQSPLDPASTRRRSSEGPEYRELNKRSKDAAELLVDLTHRRITKPEEKFDVNLIRRQPKIYVADQGESYTLETGKVIHTYEPNPFPDIRDWVIQEHGGGEYVLEIVKEGENRLFGKIHFKVDIDEYPPQPDKATGYLARAKTRLANPINYSGPRNDGGDPQQARVAKMRYDAMAADAEVEIIDKQKQAWEKQAHWDELRQQREMAARRAAELPIKERAEREERERREEKAEMRRIQEEKDKLMLSLISSRGGDGGNSQVIAAAIQSSNAMMIKALEMMGTKKDAAPHDDNMMKLLMMMMQNQMTAASTQGSKMESLFEKILLMKMDNPADQVKNALSLMDKGEERAMKFFEMMNENRQNEDEFEMDPEGGFLGNIGNLAFYVIKNLVTRASSGGGGRILDWMRMLTNRPGATQFSDAEIAAAAPRIQPYLTAEGDVQPVGYLTGQNAPAPAARPALPISTPVQAAPAVQYQPAPAQAPQQVAGVAVIAQRATPYVAAVHQTVNPPVAAPAPVAAPPSQAYVLAAPQPDGADDSVADDRASFINEMLEIALNDIRGDRHVHTWQHHALNYFDKDLRMQIANIKSDTDWFAIIQQFADPSLFNQIVGFLMQPVNSKYYERFHHAIAETVSACKEDANATA